MTDIMIYANDKDCIIGFKISGHTGYDKQGKDILCASISVLAINTINAIEHFTSDQFKYESDESKGYLSILMDNTISDDTSLLFNTFVLGLKQIQEQYGNDYIRLSYEEV